jgi:hypothetical protein
MARYVMLAFEDNDEAEAFVKAFQETRTDQRTEENHPTEHLARLFIGIPADTTSGFTFRSFSGKGEVVGMFMKPTLFCTCKAEGLWKSKDGFSQGQKYGLWVHKCGKPVQISYDHIALSSRLMSFGYNLLLAKEDQRKAYGAGSKEYYGRKA